jgi:dCMP deaminase
MVINAGIGKIVYQEGYPDDLAREMLATAGIELQRVHGSDPAGKDDGK